MYTLINKSMFHDAFGRQRPDNFSYEALNALFDMLEETEEDDTGIQLDVVAICSYYSELPFAEFISNFDTNFENDDSDDCEDDDEIEDRMKQAIEDHIDHNGGWYQLLDETVVYSDF